MIRVEIANTFLVSTGKEFVILLRGAEDERTLPITIGQLEAQSIAIELNEIPFPRPLTHDLMKSIFSEFDCKLARVEIAELVDETFYARIVLEYRGRTIEIDSRPSDAIGIALRCSAPIFVADKVMDEAGVIIPDDAQVEEPTSAEEVEDSIGKELSPIEALQHRLQKAIEEERYEEAARLRDEISKMAKSN